ncbi:DUF5131 family protein [Streptosporangium sp. NPDC051022]|uniref:DUF5131 family protein n=1 Tax=Streptosporangium sp. NPDC051022 TaxID=3155752 RepID=UPI00343E227C
MTKLGPYEVHPAADAYPLIEGEEFDKLVDSIKRNGLREPIILNHDKTVLIDGRNRYRACEIAAVDPVFEAVGSHYTELKILNMIVDLNERRRDLNPGQKAMVALVLEPMFAEATRRGRPIGDSAKLTTTNGEVIPADRRELEPKPVSADRRERESTTMAARAVGASGRTVQRAKALQRDAPDLAEKVRIGQMALDAADKQRKQRIRIEPKPEPEKPGQAMLTLRTHDGREVFYPKPQSRATFNNSDGDGVSWAAWTWNPVTGCLHGCDYCYARAGATSERLKPYYPAGFTPLFHHQRLDAPANHVVPAAHRDHPCVTCDGPDCAWKRVFVCSMADLYGRWVPDEWITQVHTSMCANPRWQYITLTKFPARYVGLDMPPGAWVGTSVDEQKRVRIAEDAFRNIGDVKVKWLSLEPLKEPLEFTDLSMFDWVVIGAQTETYQPTGTVPAFAPPFEWVARIVAQAREAGCKVHLKPNLLGAVSPQLPGMQLPDEYPTE